MGDDGDDGYTPEIKLKGASDVLDQVDKDTEEVLDFNFVPGSSGAPSSGQAKDDVDGLKGEVHSNGDWGETTEIESFKLDKNTYLDIDASELERLKRLYKGDNKKRQSLKEGRENDMLR